MIWFCVLMAIIALICVVTTIFYRRQIKQICRQMAFVREKNSCMLITSQLHDKSLVGLVDEINTLIDVNKQTVLKYKQSDENLKTTITNLSHDIRTPLTSLDGYFQLLAESNNQDERDRYVSVISKRIESLKDMLEELFTYAKLQDNEYKIELSQINISKLLLDTVFSFYDDFKAVGIQPSIDVVEHPVCINGNESALKRVFQNIIKNALLHGADNVKIKMIVINNLVEIKISNNFKSTDIVDPNMVFNRFYKADKARSNISAGLGLYIAKELVKVIGGDISANLSNDIFSITVSMNLC